MSPEQSMSKREQDEQDEISEPPPDSGTGRARQRAEPEAADEFENDEERRFFSTPPSHDEEHTLPSLEPVVAEAEHGEHLGPVPTPAEREWLARADARRATLQRWVGLAIIAGAATFIVAAADRYLAAKDDTASHFAPAVLLAADPTPTNKNNATPSTADARSTDSAPSATSVPVAVPPATPTTTSGSAVAPSAPSSTSIPVVVPSATPSAAVAPVVAPSSPPSVTPLPATPPPSASPSAVASEADAAGLREKARSLLATGHSRDGVAFARAAVESDPADARSYVLLGAGLQDLGDWAAARDVFHECALKATRGPSGTCQYFARR